MQDEAQMINLVRAGDTDAFTEILGISEDAVRKRVARGSQEFRKAYHPEEVK